MKSKQYAAVMAALMMTAACGSAVFAETAGWKTENGKTFYVMEDGNYPCGVCSIDNIVYSFAADGSLIGKYTGIARKNGVLRYYKDGVIFRGGWITDGSGTYYFDKNGVGAEGIASVDGVKYYFAPDGRLMNEASRFSVTADKDSIVLGNRDRIAFTVKADNISGGAYFGEITELQQMKEGKWYKVKPDGDFAVNDVAYILGNMDEQPYYSESQRVFFCPEDYSGSLATGEYRVVINIYAETGNVKKYCGFRIIESAESSSELYSYPISQTEEIRFVTAVNRDQKIYTPNVYGLEYYNKETEQWEKVQPKASAPAAAPVEVKAGEAVTSVLDLTAYDRTRLKSGTYRAAVGERFSHEFLLKNPYDVSAYEVITDSKRVKQVNITFVNESDFDITVKGYGQLLRSNGKSWKAVSLKQGKQLDTQITVPALTKWTRSMTLTDYYSVSALKSGSYCMKFPCEDGGFMYAYFDIA